MNPLFPALLSLGVVTAEVPATIYYLDTNGTVVHIVQATVGSYHTLLNYGGIGMSAPCSEAPPVLWNGKSAGTQILIVGNTYLNASWSHGCPSPIEYSEPCGNCPDENPMYPLLLPDKYYCGVYWKCDWGIPILQTCPDGLFFNEILGMCDWPESSECYPPRC